jgi:MFS superfamily sulfate permease-like transporter
VALFVDFPTIQTNFWDAVIAVPTVMILTQLIKIFLKVPRSFVPTIALILGLCFSLFISHRHNLIAGLFMGWFYGYAAIGTYASLKTALQVYRNE